MENLIVGVFLAAFLQLILLIHVCFFGVEHWWVAGYAVIGVILTGFYILFDLLQIITPDCMSQDDYILGAIRLYIDLVRMFIYILRLVANKK